MKLFTVLTLCLVFVASLSGCISQQLDDDEQVPPSQYEWEDDGELVIATYDVYGLTDELINEFENQSGYQVSLLKLDDAGSVLDHLLQHLSLIHI